MSDERYEIGDCLGEGGMARVYHAARPLDQSLAQGDLVILQSHLHASSTDCVATDWTGGCTKYTATYNYTDGAPCFGND